MQLETETPMPQSDPAPSVTRAVKPQGLLFVLSAPSGAGKDTVIQALKAQGADFHVVASVTTRAMRPGENEGDPYYFVSQRTFKQMVADDELLEHALVHDNWYGQPRKPIKENLQAGRDVLLKIDVQGAATVRQKVPGAIFIFLTPGSSEELVRRLVNRQTETQEELQIRLTNAKKELAVRDEYDYVIENRQGEVARAVEQLKAIMLAEHCRTHPRYVHL